MVWSRRSLEPGGAVTGRLIDAAGQPQVGAELKVTFRPKGRADWQSYSTGRIKSDREGRFHIEALLPGYEYRMSFNNGDRLFGDSLRSRRTIYLGDVRMKPSEE